MTNPNFSHSQTYIDSTGARHRFELGISVDSSDLRYNSGERSVTYPDGTKLIFGASRRIYVDTWYGDAYSGSGGATCRKICDIYDRVYYPTKVIDRNGNFIQISYQGRDADGNEIGPNIASITDALGRQITFRYSGDNLTSISMPDLFTGADHVIARFYIGTMTRQNSFADQNSYSETIKVVNRIYFPDTKSGWQFSYSSYGMIYRVEKLLGMDADPSTGVLTNNGQIAAVTEYNYPGTPINPTNNLLFLLPAYTQRTDQWVDARGVLSGVFVHRFSVDYSSEVHTSITTITAPDERTVSVIRRRYYTAQEHNDTSWRQTWDEGLVLEDKVTQDGKLYSKVNNNWDNTAGGPRLLDKTVTDDAGQQKRVNYTYFPNPPLVNSAYTGVFDNVRVAAEYKFNSTVFDSSTEIKRTEYVYETDSNWTGKWLLKLLKTVKVFPGGSIQPISQVDYTYDANALTSYPNLPTSYQTNTPAQRGNVTSISSNTNVSSPLDGVTIATSMSYDVFGNLVKVTNSNDKETVISYMDSFSDNLIRNTYAYPTQMTSATPDTTGAQGSSAPFTVSTVYDFHTGLIYLNTDSNGQNTFYEYNDPARRLTKVTQPDGGWSSYEYSDVFGNFYVRTQSLFQTSPTSVVLEARQYFDGIGQNVRSASLGGNTWLVVDSTYDTVNRSVSTSNPFRSSSLVGEVNPSGNWTTTTYDPLGRVSTMTMPDGAQLKTDYDGTRILVRDQAGNQMLSRSNELGQLTDVWEIKAAEVGVTETVAFPNHTDVTAGYRTGYIHDVVGNLRKVEQGAQRRYFAYDSLSRLIRVSNPEQTSSPSLALPSALVSSLSDNNNIWSLAYDYDQAGNNQKGNLSSRTDSRGVKTSYFYDALNRLINRSYSLTGSTPPNYVATPDVQYFYDGTGMPLENGIPLPTPAYAKGLLTTVKSSVSQSSSTEFDLMGRVKTYRQMTDNQTYIMKYTYNASGAVVTEQYPSGRVMTTEYDEAGRIAGVHRDGGYYAGGAPTDTANRIQYAAHGAVSAMRLGNGLWEHISFDPKRLQPTQIGLGTTNTDSSLLRLDYAYNSSESFNNNNGNIRKQTITVPGIAQPLVQTYSYDQLNRLRSAEESKGAVRQWIQSFNYDRFGNRSINTGTDPSGQPLTTPSLVGPNPQINATNNRITPRPNSNEFYQYDNAGNLTVDGSGNSLDNDSENLQTTFTAAWRPTSKIRIYTYDGSGKRVRSNAYGSHTTYVYNPAGQMIAEYGEPRKLVTGQEINYVTIDILGTPRVLTGVASSRPVVARHDYLPFGEEIGASFGGRNTVNDGTGSVGQPTPSYGAFGLVRQGFTGYERDSETELDYAQARYYSSLHGRFTSPDPLIASATPANPQTWNRYAYCANNPINRVDPTGLDWWYDMNATESKQPEWFDRDPGRGYDRWTNISSYVYYSNDSHKWWALNPNANQALSFNNEGDAQTALKSFVGPTGSGIPMTHGEREFAAGVSTGISPFGYMFPQIFEAQGLDTTSRDFDIGVAAGIVTSFGYGAFPKGGGLSVGSGNAYSVAYETELAATSYPGFKRPLHFREANGNLLNHMNANAELNAMMEELIPGIRGQLQGSRGGISSSPPQEWTWHHASKPGVMQLVPRVQHRKLFKLFHEGGRGGFHKWGK